ncbi:ABC transporter substrate-binding protein [Phytohabitans kaempferiae]|uniref:ABC transporter substrate-binding protein n=1 Tax=Phytohabitans kaempferiae TaxID=1620943 RepID=A0ABV6M306_9ACTN
MIRTVRSVLRPVGAGAVALLLLAVCAWPNVGSGDRTSANGEGFVYLTPAVPQQLDMWNQFEGDGSRIVGYEMGSTLVTPDSAAMPDAACEELPGTDDLEPGLASGWTVTENAIDFTIREGVLSAAGNELTAYDVEWSFERTLENGANGTFSAGLANFRAEDPYEAVDERTFRVHTNGPVTMSVAIFQYLTFMVLDSEEVKAHATPDDPWGNAYLQTHIPNFGPWAIESFTPGTEIVWQRNPNFWNAENAGDYGRFILRAMPESSLRTQVLQVGEAEYAEKLDFADYSFLEKSDDVDVISCLSNYRDTLVLNQATAELADPRVRRAISLAIDRDVLVQGPYRGYGFPADHGVSRVYLDGSAAGAVELDRETAKELLAEAGYPDGIDLALTISSSRPGAHAQPVAVQLKDQLAKVGIDLTLEVIGSASQFINRFNKAQYELMLYMEPPPVADLYYQMNLYNASESYQNTFGYHEAAFEEVLAQLRLPLSEADYAAARDRMSEISADTVPVVYLVDRANTHAFASSVDGYVNSPTGTVNVWALRSTAE